MKFNFKTIAFLASIILLWHIVAEAALFNPTLFPGPLKVFNALLALAENRSLFSDTAVSLWRVLAGLAIGSATGIFAGMLTGRILFLEETTAPALHILRAFPPVAIIPLMIVWFGIGDFAKIISIAFAVFFPVWLSTLIGAKSIHQDYLRTAKVFSKKPAEIFAKVMLPATTPFIKSGVRIGISIAFIMVFVSELAGASQGLGYMIAFAQITYRIDNMLAGLIVLGVLAAATDFLFAGITDRMFPWSAENVQ